VIVKELFGTGNCNSFNLEEQIGRDHKDVQYESKFSSGYLKSAFPVDEMLILH